MDESEEIITIVFSIAGFLSIIIIICLIRWSFIRRKSKPIKHTHISYRHQYQRSKNVTSNNIINNKRRKSKRRFHTNESDISFSFNPPHLINQNVKNLDKLRPNEPYEDKQLDRCYMNPTTEPIYTSLSSVSTPPISNLRQTHQLHQENQQLNNLHFQFLNELNHVLSLQQDQRVGHPLKYSQSCRQPNDLLPFDYYRSMTPSISSSIENLFEPNYIYTTTNYSNATLMRKARLGNLTDDTAILY